jgi:preprotein translocase subunit SecE
MAVGGKDAKGMAKSLAMAPGDDENRILGHVKSWPDKTRDFYHDVRTEMKKVTTPSLKEVRATTAVVIITVFLFAAYFWAVDLVIGRGVDQMFRYFAKR